MQEIPVHLRERLDRHGQSHVLSFWEQLDANQRRALHDQLQRVDLAQLERLYALREQPQAELRPETIKPVSVIPHASPDRDSVARIGEQALRAGQVAALVVAGGQGSRLGFEHPKGMYPVGPLSKKSLFQIHAEKILAASRRFGKAIPFLIMTSPATHEETVRYFRDQRFFGLPESEVYFFSQGSMPALDLHSGKLLLEEPARLFLGPDGHGGTLTALAGSGLLRKIKDRGIKQISYFQVDNPLVKITDPVFLGYHIRADAEVSSKVTAKTDPREKVGVFACIEGKCAIVEYSDLPDTLASAVDDSGRLLLWAGNPAIHLFDVNFLERATANPEGLPFHLAKKKVPHIDHAGQRIEPTSENALKFERFIFDVLPLAERWVVLETTRAEEFAPLKNADGADSPATVDAALCNLAADWIRRADGEATAKVEISPLHALDAAELASKLPPGTRFDTPTYLE